MIKEYLSAGYPILAVKTYEPERAQRVMLQEIFNAKYESEDSRHRCYSWDILNGIVHWHKMLKCQKCNCEYISTDIAEYNEKRYCPNDNTELAEKEFAPSKGIQPGDNDKYPQGIFPLHWLQNEADNAALFLWNYHKYLIPGNIEIIQALQNYRDYWKQCGKVVILLVPDIDIVKELDKSITVIDFNLPNGKEIEVVLEDLAQGNNIGIEGDEEKRILVNAASGLTLFEAENAFALSSKINSTTFSPQIVLEQKAQMVKKNASLEYSHFKESFSKIGGLGNLKQFCSKVIKSDLSRGVMLLGVPGTGKSMFSKALGSEAGLPTLSLDFGKLFGSLVGESEKKIREALKIIDAMAPCVLFIDEIEKGLSGVQSSHQTDGGTGSRVFGSFLTWLNDHQTKVFVIATCNSIQKLPPEFLRAERWDAIFFVDLPQAEERNIILDLYKTEYMVSGEPPSMEGWTGAEIKTMCRIAAMMNVSLKEAAHYVIPLSRSMGKEINELKEWAENRCIPASIPRNTPINKTRKFAMARSN